MARPLRGHRLNAPADRDAVDRDIAAREAARILDEYARRRSELPRDFYSFFRPAELFRAQQRVRAVLDLLRSAGLDDLRGRRVCEVGCGRGDWLGELEAWGARREHLAAIELDAVRGREAQARFAAWRGERGEMLAGGADIRIGDASRLPWPDASFDLVIQSTVLSSVLDVRVRRMIAAEMVRVLRPDGAILWYDLRVDNPRNPAVRGIRAAEVRALFPACRVRLRRITLAPPLARRVVPVSWLAAAALERLVLLNTHYLGLLTPRGDAR